MLVTRGFKGKRRGGDADRLRLPPGQFLTPEFPVLTAGPTQHTPLDRWSLALQHGGSMLGKWSWEQFEALPQTEITSDIHCVTKWSKFDTRWRGVTIDDLLRAAGLDAAPTGFLMAHCDGGYTTNLLVSDLIEARAMIATHFDDLPLLPSHGGPGSPARAAPLFLEEREVGATPRLSRGGFAGLLGVARLSHPWRSVARAALYR